MKCTERRRPPSATSGHLLSPPQSQRRGNTASPTTTVPPASCAGVQPRASSGNAADRTRRATRGNPHKPCRLPASRARPSAPPAAGVAPSHPPVNHHQLARPRQPHERNYHRPLPILPCRSPPPTLPPPLLSPGPPAARPDVPTIFAARRTLATSWLRPPRRGKGAAYDAE